MAKFMDYFFSWQEMRIYWWAWVRRGQHQGSPECRARHLSRGPWLRMYLTPQWSGMSCFSATMFSNSSALNLANPHLLGDVDGSSRSQGIWTGPCGGLQSYAPCSTAWYGWTFTDKGPWSQSQRMPGITAIFTCNLSSWFVWVCDR